MQTVAPIPASATTPSDTPAMLRQIERQLLKNPVFVAHFGRLAEAWRSQVSPGEAERFLREFESSIDTECIVRSGLSPRPMTLRQRLERRRYRGNALGDAFGCGLFVDIALLWEEWGRREDALRCMKKAEAQAVAKGRGEWVEWDAVRPCHQAWLAMGLREKAESFLEQVRKNLHKGYLTDWIRLAELHGVASPAGTQATQCLEAAESLAKTSQDFLEVAEGWIECLCFEGAARCVREAERKCDPVIGPWQDIADAWRRLGSKEDHLRCAIQALEWSWTAQL